MMGNLPSLRIKNIEVPFPIIQGGMGIGVSLSPLASAVASEGGIGIVSSACLDRLVPRMHGYKRTMNPYDAVYEEVSRAKEKGGAAGINIMVALMEQYGDSVKAAIDAGADVIISGGGLPLSLPGIQNSGDTALIPIISSARALDLICKKWEKDYNYRPDAAILEGPLAGGHLGFKFSDIYRESNRLENLLGPVIDCADRHGGFPIITAGGIYTYEDIQKFIHMGASGVQIGTRFLCTEESSASDSYKTAVINARRQDIVTVKRPGSPCKMPFRVIRSSPMFQAALEGLRNPKCDKGYVRLFRDDSGTLHCLAEKDNRNFLCVCNGLLSSAGYNPTVEEPLYTVGVNAYRVKEVLPVRKLMERLTGRSKED